MFDTFVAQIPPAQTDNALALANTRSRLRMTTLYYFAGLYGYMVVGTGNKIEDFGVGFFTKYGDGGVDVSPIADLMKSEVYELADYLEIIPEIRQAPPTDGLFGDDRTRRRPAGGYLSRTGMGNDLCRGRPQGGRSHSSTSTSALHL